MRIQEIAKEIGYSANLQARGLRNAKSGLVGMILPEHDNRFFSSLSQSFASEVRKRGNCPAIVCTRRNEREELDAVSSLISYAVDALFIVGASNPDALSQLCSNADLPHVFVDQPCDRAPSVVTDNYKGARQLAGHLVQEISSAIESAETSLYFLGGNALLPASARRIDGFKDALKARDINIKDSHIIACGYDRNMAGSELRRLHGRLGRLPAGMLVNSIDCFEGVLEYLSQLPEEEVRQCTIGCFDYDPFCALLRFPVHMVRQRTQSLIRIAYECIESGSQDPCLILVKPEFILGQLPRHGLSQ